MGSREVPYDRKGICNICGKKGAYDFMGDLICEFCLDEPEPRNTPCPLCGNKDAYYSGGDIKCITCFQNRVLESGLTIEDLHTMDLKEWEFILDKLEVKDMRKDDGYRKAPKAEDIYQGEPSTQPDESFGSKFKNKEGKAEFLFGLLDDIDTLDDACKNDDKAFREKVYKIQQRRYEVASTDGYEISWKDDDGE